MPLIIRTVQEAVGSEKRRVIYRGAIDIGRIDPREAGTTSWRWAIYRLSPVCGPLSGEATSLEQVEEQIDKAWRAWLNALQLGELDRCP
jgi:hypothetical protein